MCAICHGLNQLCPVRMFLKLQMCSDASAGALAPFKPPLKKQNSPEEDSQISAKTLELVAGWFAFA